MNRDELKQLNQSLRRVLRLAVAYKRMAECVKRLTTQEGCRAHSKSVDALLMASDLLTDDDINRVSAVLEKKP